MHKGVCLELELELILSQMAQKPVLPGEVDARAWRVGGQARGGVLCTSSRSGVQEIMRTIVAVAGAAHCVRTVTMMTCEG